MAKTRIERQLIQHEGWRNFPYEDTVGKVSIGVGRNLDDRGLREDEILLMLRNDIAESQDELRTQAWTRGLDQVRTGILIDMCFNLGLPRLLKFQKMIDAIVARNFDEAADEMLDSKWARQVGPRAQALARAMRTGNQVPLHD